MWCASKTGAQNRRERSREEQLARRIGFDVGGDSLPGIGAICLRRAKLSGRDIEKSRAHGFAAGANCGEEN